MNTQDIIVGRSFKTNAIIINELLCYRFIHNSHLSVKGFGPCVRLSSSFWVDFACSPFVCVGFLWACRFRSDHEPQLSHLDCSSYGSPQQIVVDSMNIQYY